MALINILHTDNLWEDVYLIHNVWNSDIFVQCSVQEVILGNVVFLHISLKKTQFICAQLFLMINQQEHTDYNQWLIVKSV